MTLDHNSRNIEIIILKTIVLNEISTFQDYKTVVEMIKKSKPLSHEPFILSRLAFAHPVGMYWRWINLKTSWFSSNKCVKALLITFFNSLTLSKYKQILIAIQWHVCCKSDKYKNLTMAFSDLLTFTNQQLGTLILRGNDGL